MTSTPNRAGYDTTIRTFAITDAEAALWKFLPGLEDALPVQRRDLAVLLEVARQVPERHPLRIACNRLLQQYDTAVQPTTE